MKFGIGQAVPRLEDDRFLTGRGQYTDDLSLAGEVRGHVVRSPFAHTEIRALDVTAARAATGVLDVLTADDLKHLGPMPCDVAFPGRDGKLPAAPPRPVLATGRARYMGEPLAFIVAESLEAALDAADLVEMDLEPLPAVTDTEGALEEGAPELWPEAAGNLSLDWELGDAAATEAAFEAAVHRVKMRLENNRVVANPMETRAAIATYDEATGFTLYAGTQGVWGVQRALAKAIFDIPPERLRVVTLDVGGGFGMKGFVYPEYALVMEAAKRLGRPVRWTAERSESFISDTQGRDVVSEVELALDADHKITGFRVESVANFGAYLSQFGPYIPTLAPAQVIGGVYDIPAVYVHVRAVITNTPPIDAYRGAGRPEAAHMIECTLEQAARELGVSVVELRRKNFIREDQMPFTSAAGSKFDSGAFEALMERAMENADWQGFAGRRQASEAAGNLRGIGMGYYIESTIGMPTEEVTLEITAAGRVRFYVGTQSQGQGHLTTFAQILAERLGIDPDAIDLIEGDTAKKDGGGGTSGSRTLQMIGNAALTVCDGLIARGRELSAELWDVAAEDVSFDDGLLRVASRNLSIGLIELAGRLDESPSANPAVLESTASYEMSGATFPNGCHIAELEIDRETGRVTLEAYTVVDDFGTVINPMIVEGQVHGGVVQGLGQALIEHCVFDPDDGGLMTGSFMDYGIPRADDVPAFSFEIKSTPCTTNPLGMKGCGEAGTVGALPAVANALNDAMASAGAEPVQMPATPERVWAVLRVS
jgi:carbon-monoxide dehydrogenase large subunit